jgi:hypothetical protein
MNRQKVFSSILYHCPPCEVPNYRREVWVPPKKGK